MQRRANICGCLSIVVDLKFAAEGSQRSEESRMMAELAAHSLDNDPSVIQQIIAGIDEDALHSGGGIIEFSPDKAGMDVTPANYTFPERDKTHAGSFSAFTGMYA